MVSPKELYEFICAHAEVVDGRVICRESLIAYLRKQGVAKPGRLRKKLVRELENQGLVKRKHPRSIHLYLLQPPPLPDATPSDSVSPSDLYEYILMNAEDLEGGLVCRASLIAYLKDRGVPKPGQARKRLVQHLENAGLVKRKHPRSNHLYILGRDATKRKAQSPPPTKQETDAALRSLVKEISKG